MSFLTLPTLGHAEINWFNKKSDIEQARVNASYIEMRTGPGRGFPIFHIVEKNHLIHLTAQKTSWIKVKTHKELEGWIHETDLEKLTRASGERYTMISKDDSIFQGIWEMGAMNGTFSGADLFALYAGYHFTPNLTAEFIAEQALSNISKSTLYGGQILHTSFVGYKYRPYLLLGLGVIDIAPRAIIIAPEDRSEEYLKAGIGLRTRLARTFFLRAEYNSYIILTSRDDNEHIDEWKLGLSTLF